MTSTALVHAEIFRFLKSEEPEVLCLTGAWGVGKTYTWKKILHEAKKSNGITLKKYAYVSLFGQNSLEDVRAAIVEETRPISTIGEASSLLTVEGMGKAAAVNWRSLINQARRSEVNIFPKN